jgi:hypothetical protein
MNLKVAICQRDCHVQLFSSLQIHCIAVSLKTTLFWEVQPKNYSILGSSTSCLFYTLQLD